MFALIQPASMDTAALFKAPVRSFLRRLFFILCWCLVPWFTQAQALTKTTSDLTLASSTVSVGQSTTLTATIKPSAAKGTVRFMAGTTNLGNATLNSTGVASLATTFATVGTQSLTAVYAGNSTYAASTSSAKQLTVKATATASTLALGAAPSSSVANEAVTLRATISPSTATGTVTFKDGSASLGTANLNAGVATLKTSFAVAGAHHLSASYAGSAAVSASNSNALSFTVAGAPMALPSPPVSPTPVVSLAYDAQGHPTVVTQAPDSPDLALATSNEYDALGRTKKVLDPSGNSTVISYDSSNQVSAVFDPIGLTTQYDRDGLGQVKQQRSPDTGSTELSYDPAGNLLTSKDSRGVLATHTYDAINRLTGSTFSQAGQQSQSYTWIYDQTGGDFANGIGRLTTISFPEGTTTYAYNAQGRVTKAQQTLHPNSTANQKAVVLSTLYEYDAAGNVIGVTYPSGRKLNIGYGGGLPVALGLGKDASSTPISLITGLRYAPFGAPQSWNWAMTSGSLAHSRVMDTHGRLIRYPLGEYLRDVSYDGAGRITGYTHYRAVSGATSGSSAPSLDQQFSYNASGRLTQVSTAQGTWTYMYDGTGNRINVASDNGVSSWYNLKPKSNQLASIDKPAITLTYDAAGNATSDGNFALQYDLKGRLVRATNAQGSTSYTYDNNGLRVRKSTGLAGGTTIFVYDAEGHLLGEYDASGNPIREIVWLGDMPLAVFTPDSAYGANAASNAPQVYYIHADHLNTPRVVVDRANTVRWRWMSEPFGTTAAESSPAGQADFVFNLRFPGQYYDVESGIHQNWNRDYVPGWGRYAQSDPIGLGGGMNTYTYVGGNPLSRTDRLGLATDEEIRKAVATLRCANPGEFEKLARSITMADMGKNGAGMTDWRNNITLNSRDYGDSSTPVDKLGPYQSELMLQTIAHEMLHVNEALGSRLLSNSFRMGNPLGYFHRQLDEKADAMITPAFLKQFRDAMSSGDAGCICSQ
ncbi:Ig-like domain repeat protein [Acidovorax sp. SUPP950]|uniref:RHS repeat domain-containing protein n=1 Tax=Acidovorax sp. SUPP950 TaxID=511901 RepID=UPI0023CF96A2|nr:Ig-like domain repeat protein [Acidovorax sp. SUPP950]GKS73563.1 Ig-like domain repeat protein [Acidovorax sp. SUPP950]